MPIEITLMIILASIWLFGAVVSAAITTAEDEREIQELRERLSAFNKRMEEE